LTRHTSCFQAGLVVRRGRLRAAGGGQGGCPRSWFPLTRAAVAFTDGTNLAARHRRRRARCPAPAQWIIGATPLEFSQALSERVGADVHLKCENLQRAGSFKIRGAYTRMARLSEQEKARGVVAASAGNHAQGCVALAAQLLGIRSTVFMPLGCADPQADGDRGTVAIVEQLGTTVTRPWSWPDGSETENRRGPDPSVRPPRHRGRVEGTCGLRDSPAVPDVATLQSSAQADGGCWPVSATAVKAKRPDVASRRRTGRAGRRVPAIPAAGHPVPLATMATMADGIAVAARVRCRMRSWTALVDSIETVSEDTLSRAVLFLLERAKQLVEPAGAAAVARLLDAGKGVYDGPVVAVLSGGTSTRCCSCGSSAHGLVIARALPCSSVCGFLTAPRFPGGSAGRPCRPPTRTSWISNTFAPAPRLPVKRGRDRRTARGQGTAHCQELLSALRGKGVRADLWLSPAAEMMADGEPVTGVVAREVVWISVATS